MKWNELLKFSFQSLWRRKLRSSLTILGVVIGTAAIVVMTSIGIGQTYAFQDMIERSGTLTLITVNTSGYWGSDGASDDDVYITKDTVNAFAAIEHVKCASPVYSFDVYARSGKYEAYLWVNAMSLEMLRELKLPILEGELPQEGDPIKLIAGRYTEFNFMDPNAGYYDYSFYEDPYAEPPVKLMDSQVFVVYDTNAYWNAAYGEGEMPKKYILETSAIVGSTPEEGWSQYDYNCYADLAAVEMLFQKMFNKNQWPNQSLDKNGKPIFPMRYNEAYVLVDDIDNVTDVQRQITDMGYQAYSNLDFLKSMQEQSRIIQFVLGGIGAVSMLVAAIGIANTMLMSIFERTKEIGVFKVLGCSLSNIRSMFLAEAGLIGAGGGALGLILSYGLSALINMLVGGGGFGVTRLSVIPMWLALMGIGFALGVALIAGISPAIRAMKLSPLEAIRSL